MFLRESACIRSVCKLFLFVSSVWAASGKAACTASGDHPAGILRNRPLGMDCDPPWPRPRSVSRGPARWSWSIRLGGSGADWTGAGRGEGGVDAASGGLREWDDLIGEERRNAKADRGAGDGLGRVGSGRGRALLACCWARCVLPACLCEVKQGFVERGPHCWSSHDGYNMLAANQPWSGTRGA